MSLDVRYTENAFVCVTTSNIVKFISWCVIQMFLEYHKRHISLIILKNVIMKIPANIITINLSLHTNSGHCNECFPWFSSKLQENQNSKWALNISYVDIDENGWKLLALFVCWRLVFKLSMMVGCLGIYNQIIS